MTAKRRKAQKFGFFEELLTDFWTNEKLWNWKFAITFYFSIPNKKIRNDHQKVFWKIAVLNPTKKKLWYVSFRYQKGVTMDMEISFPNLTPGHFWDSLRFWVGVFYPQAFFTLRSFTDIFGTFLWLKCGQVHPIQDLPLCLPSQSRPFRLAHGLELFIL